MTQRLLLQRGSQTRRVLLTALGEHCHELELLVAALILGNDEIGVSVLGLGVPFDELTLVCEKIQPAAVVVFAQRALSTAHHRRLLKLGQTLDCATLLAWVC